MICIESLKSHIGKISVAEFMSLAKSIYKITEFIHNDYQKYKTWYFCKQLPRVFTPNGDILFAKSNDGNIVGMACLKKVKEEKKICTLYVLEEYRNQHLGTRLVDASIGFLGTTKPFITFADYKLPMFQPIIDKYGWELTEVVEGLYNDKTKELCFNGRLTKQTNFGKQRKIIK